MQRLNFNVIP